MLRPGTPVPTPPPTTSQSPSRLWFTTVGTPPWPVHVSNLVGMTITPDIHAAVLAVPNTAWTPAYDVDSLQRDGAWIAEITDRGAEMQHPGAELRITGIDGNRITCHATNTRGGQIAGMELHHRCRVRCEARIRAARNTGLPFRTFTHNQVWLDIACLTSRLAWTAILTLTGPAHRWEPKTLRLRLFAAAGRIIDTARRVLLPPPDHWPWTPLLLAAFTRLNTSNSAR